MGAIIHKQGIAKLCALLPRKLKYTYCGKRWETVMPAKFLEEILFFLLRNYAYLMANIFVRQ